ncbi:hypothetical protein [Bacillus cytotoxicus]|uniref:hypothetical protein n=1 Tax=Bacillus cytotoxicus TaxID=580165 RepID=UPI003D7E71D9
MNEREDLEERRERTILDNLPSEETTLKMAEFFMRTSVPRILAEMKAGEEAEEEEK